MIGLSGLRIKHGHFYGSGYKSHIQCSVPGRVARVQSLAEELQMLWCDQKKKKKGIRNDIMTMSSPSRHWEHLLPISPSTTAIKSSPAFSLPRWSPRHKGAETINHSSASLNS